MYQISTQGTYIKVELKVEADFQILSEVIETVINHPQYPQCNDIWIFGNEGVSLKFEHLDQITDLIARLYPPDATRNKTAIVTSPGLTAAFAELWAGSAGKLPYEVKIFSGLIAAEKWVTA